MKKQLGQTSPDKFEAGTPPIAQAIGLGEAIDYINSYGIEAIGDHELDVLNYAMQKLASIEGLKLIGTAPESQCHIIYDGLRSPHDIATIIDQNGVRLEQGIIVHNHLWRGLIFRLPHELALVYIILVRILTFWLRV